MSDETPIPTGYAGLNKVYGDPRSKNNTRPSPAWEAENIIGLQMAECWPAGYPMNYDGNAIKQIRVHKLAAPSLKAALQDIWNHARAEVKKRDGYDLTSDYYDKQTYAYLKSRHLDQYGGCYNYRPKRRMSSLSVHSWGCAIDIDPAHNGLGDTTPDMPRWVVDIFAAHGWSWGGNFSRPDGMHFQRARGV